VVSLAAERGRLVVQERPTGDPDLRDAASRRFLDAVGAAGGAPLADALQRDGAGAARRLLARTVWVVDLPTALALQASAPAGWAIVVRDGSAILDDTTVTLGTADGTLERKAEHARLSADLERARTEHDTRATAAASAMAARDALEAARAEESRQAAARRTAEDAERTATRAVEANARETAWASAQLERAEADVERTRAAVPATAPTDGAGGEATDRDVDRSALATWEARAADLRDRRDRLAARLALHDTARQAAEQERARAETTAALADERVARSERDATALLEREAALTAERDALRADLATAIATEAAARSALGELHAADASDRTRLTDAERAASGARERLRGADDRLRAADHAELEARLGLESLREGVLVELAGLGELGLASLGVTPAPATVETEAAADASVADPAPGVELDGDDDLIADDTAALEAALAAVAERWASEPATQPVPPPGRLAQLRRRYHELGAANPFAVDEYAELKTRLETLETQAVDLRAAISTTRDLIVELDTLIADQFRTTFQALETAFERRFEQLFGGGYARLSLTDPSDLGSTGIEIVARPPGKKPQALAMLSGGERALTAVALLFAMLEVRPVPFCVLDEVDAALDEANIGRFADALRSLAHQTQFIVITHNRGTIEAADALYGVTVGDDSVSRVISLRLDEAQALASDRRLELASVD
jgi:chromosome segregation protein